MADDRSRGHRFEATQALRQVLNRAVAWGLLDFNPATMGGNRTPIIDQEQLEQGGASWVVAYHAHLWNEGKPDGAPYESIPSRLRRLTVEEAAAIQTFPRDMKWTGRVGSQFKQIGNAVPPRLAFHVACAVREALGLGAPAYPEWIDESPLAEEQLAA